MEKSASYGAKNTVIQVVNIVEPIGNSDHSAIRFNIYLSGKLPRKSNTSTFDFKRGNLPKMRKLVKRKLKGGIKRVKSLQNAWSLLKSTIIETELKCIPQVRER